MKPKNTKKLLGKKGFTLVELIVSFALTAILMTAAAMVMSSYMHAYTWCNAAIHIRSVSDMLMETITSELASAAKASAEPGSTNLEVNIMLRGVLKDDAGKIIETEDGGKKYRKAVFIDKRNNNTQMTVGENLLTGAKEADSKEENPITLEAGYLVLRYVQYGWNEKGEKSTEEIKTIDWQYPKESYVGNKIEALNFYIVDKKKKLIGVELILKNLKTDSTYTATRVVQCYNVDENENAIAASDDLNL